MRQFIAELPHDAGSTVDLDDLTELAAPPNLSGRYGLVVLTQAEYDDLRASGETPSSLKATIKARLADFVKLNAGSEITIAVQAAASYRITVSGAQKRWTKVALDRMLSIR